MAEEKVGLRFVVDGRGAAVGAFGSVRSSLLSVRGAALATGAAVFGVGRALSSSIDEAREAERVGKVTEARLRSTGHAAHVTKKEIGNLATAISRKTGVDDEAIQSGENLLLTFRKVRNEQGKGNKIFNQATWAITDYAAAMAGTNEGLNLKTASIQVGKALNDPIKGITALSKNGVNFSEQQRAVIKSLVDSGHTMDAQKIILRELRAEFGNTAAAQATMGDKVSVAWGNIQEQLGTSLLPLLDRAERAFLKQGVPAIEHYLDVFDKRGVPAIKGFVDEARPLAEEVLPAIGTGLQNAADALRVAAPYAKDVVGAFNDLPDSAQTAILATGALGFAALKTKKLLSSVGNDSGLSAMLSKYGGATPVYVVNEGFGGLPGRLGADGEKGGKASTLGKVAALLTAGRMASLVGEALPFAARIPKPLPALGSEVRNLTPLTTPPGTFGIFDEVLRDPAKVAGRVQALRDLYDGTTDLGAGAKGARERVTELDRSLDLLATPRKVNVDTKGATAELSDLERQALDTLNALIPVLSGGLFGGSPSTPSPRNRPRVPASPPRHTPSPAGRVAAGGGRGPTHLSATLVLPDGKVLTDLVVAELKDQEARR